MTEISFYYDGQKKTLQCQKSDKMKDIMDKYFSETGINKTNKYFLYNGEKIDGNLTVIQTSCKNDRITNEMSVLIFDDEEEEDNNEIIINVIYNNRITKIKCESGEKMEDIFKKFCEKNLLEINSIYFWFKKRMIIQKVGIQDYLNYDGKKRNKIEIYATSKSNEYRKSKQVICPICGELALIKFKNSKISICECKYHHNIDDLNLNEFENSQLINESKIICDICERNNKNDSYRNIFYICNTCKLYLCPLCKANHDKTHNFVDYDQICFKCDTHDELYSSYCKTCNKNLCTICEQDHNDHDTIRLGKLLKKKNDLDNKIKEYKISFAKFKEDTERIINILQKVLNNFEIIYKINEEIIHNFDIKNRNYQYLNNLKEIYKVDFSKKLNNVNNFKNYGQKIIQICKLYNSIYNNELNIDLFEDKEKLINESECNSSVERLNSQKTDSREKIMTVIFVSEDQKVHYALICKNTDKFKDIEEKLYKVYPDYSKTNNYFKANNLTITKSKDLDDNKIKNSDIITLYFDKK